MENGELARSRSRSSTSSGSRSQSGSRSRSRQRSLSRSRTRSRSRGRRRSRDRSRSRRDSGDRETVAAAVEEAKLLFEAGVIKFCDEHKVDVAPSTCVTCRLVSRTVRGPVLPELIKLIKAKAADTTEIPAAAQRFATRIDEKPPTLTLSESDMSLAQSLFGCGKMVPPTMFDDFSPA